MDEKLEGLKEKMKSLEGLLEIAREAMAEAEESYNRIDSLHDIAMEELNEALAQWRKS